MKPVGKSKMEETDKFLENEEQSYICSMSYVCVYIYIMYDKLHQTWDYTFFLILFYTDICV